MAVEKSPAFQFYPKDFLTDERVRLMSHTERGIYVTLLCFCWLEQSLPAQPSQLALLVNVKASQFQRMWDDGTMAACFYESNGRLFHKRLDAEREKQEAFRRRASDGGKAALDRRGNGGRFSTRVAGANHQPDVVLPAGVLSPGSTSSPISNLRSALSKKKQTSSVGPPKQPADPRVGEFLKWFPSEYKHRRHGADYLVKHSKHGPLVKQMLGATDLDRLKKLAMILMSDKTDEAWIVETDRGIEILSTKFSWLSDKLAAWEARQKEHTA